MVKVEYNSFLPLHCYLFGVGLPPIIKPYGSPGEEEYPITETPKSSLRGHMGRVPHVPVLAQFGPDGQTFSDMFTEEVGVFVKT